MRARFSVKPVTAWGTRGGNAFPGTARSAVKAMRGQWHLAAAAPGIPPPHPSSPHATPTAVQIAVPVGVTIAKKNERARTLTSSSSSGVLSDPNGELLADGPGRYSLPTSTMAGGARAGVNTLKGIDRQGSEDCAAIDATLPHGECRQYSLCPPAWQRGVRWRKAPPSTLRESWPQ